MSHQNSLLDVAECLKKFYFSMILYFTFRFTYYPSSGWVYSCSQVSQSSHFDMKEQKKSEESVNGMDGVTKHLVKDGPVFS